MGTVPNSTAEQLAKCEAPTTLLDNYFVHFHSSSLDLMSLRQRFFLFNIHNRKGGNQCNRWFIILLLLGDKRSSTIYSHISSWGGATGNFRRLNGKGGFKDVFISPSNTSTGELPEVSCRWRNAGFKLRNASGRFIHYN